MVSPDDVKFSCKRHLRGFDDPSFLQGLQRSELPLLQPRGLTYQGTDMVIKVLDSLIPGIHGMPDKG